MTAITNTARSLCLSAVLILPICTPAAAQKYTTTLTSGPFLVSSLAKSVDWAVVNNDIESVELRVTVYKLLIGETKLPVPPGPVIVDDLPSGETWHNANSANVTGGVFFPGFYYEVVVEATSDKIHPNVTQWLDDGGNYLPGTLIPAGDFAEIKTKPPKR